MKTLKLLALTAAIPIVGLTACGDSEPDVSSSRQATATSGPSTEQTEPTPTTVEARDNLEDAVEYCAASEYQAELASERMQEAFADGPSLYRGVLNKVADKNGQTVDEWLADLWSDVFTLDTDGSITLGGAYKQYDSDAPERYWDELDPSGTYMAVAWECLASAIDLPARVASHISTTRAMDGTQNDSWDDYEARWTYHPDNGLTVTIWESD